MKCVNCRYWELGVQFNGEPLEGVGLCTKAKPLWHCADYLDDSYEDVILIYPDNGMYCVDGSQYHAQLVTEPDFGCIKFEENNDES